MRIGRLALKSAAAHSEASLLRRLLAPVEDGCNRFALMKPDANVLMNCRIYT